MRSRQATGCGSVSVRAGSAVLSVPAVSPLTEPVTTIKLVRVALLDEELGSGGVGDLEVLFREARRRRRRRRLGMVAVAAAAGLVSWAIAAAIGGPTPRPHPALRATRPPRAAVGSDRTRPRSARLIPAGKYVPSAPSFPTSTFGLVTVGGFSRDGFEAWVERTDDGGRRWVATRALTGFDHPAASQQLTFVTATQGWAAGPDLYYTVNGGKSWRRQLSATSTVKVVGVEGTAAWIVAERCPSTGSTCAETIYSSPYPGGPLTPIPSQPPRHLGVIDLVRPTRSAAWALLSTDHGRSSLGTTIDSGAHWTVRSLPCAGPSDELTTRLAAGGPHSMWVTCQRQSGSTDPNASLTVIYQSANAGRTWRRITPTGIDPAHQLSDFSSLEVVTPSVAWATESDESTTGTVLRSIDGGRNWYVVLDGSTYTADAFFIGGLTAPTARTAWVSGFGNGRRLEVDRTTDGGRTWRTAVLPRPTATPSTNSHP
jgi:hypothetical protein